MTGPPNDLETIARVISEAAAVGRAEEPREAIRLLTVDDLANLPEPTWLVDGWLPEHGLTNLYGASGSYKSFLALAWGLSVASGIHWHGHNVEPGPVVYLSLEGGYGLNRRIEAWRSEFPDADLSEFRAVVVPLSLLDGSTVEELGDAIRDAVGAPKLLVVDTMARAMQGGDENSPSDVGRFIAGLDGYIHSWDTSVLVVHHTGHSETGRERGHSSFPAAADCRISMKRDPSRARVTVTQEKAKDSEEREPIVLARRVVPLEGLDAQDNPRSSIVLDWIGERPPITVAPDTSGEDCREAILRVLGNAPEPLSENAVKTALLGRGWGGNAILSHLDDLVREGEVNRSENSRRWKLHALPMDSLDLDGDEA